ncbi:MAG: DUF1800 domain-containing protein [Candidatus Acidiferrales bacterium]
MHKIRGSEKSFVHRLDSAGAGITSLLLIGVLFLAVPFAQAEKKVETAGNATAPASPVPNSFKGKLPITELSEDEAVLHALNRLAYGPRPGDIERVKKMGLETWIAQQLDPGSIDDSVLDARLAEKYPTLKKSSTQLLEEFPPPNQAAKKEGITKQEFKQEQQEKRRADVQQAVASGDDKAQDMLAHVQGPQRIIVELSMAKIERAVSSNRQLEAVMEDFWFNHFNVDSAKGADRWLVTSYVRDSIRPHTLGKFQDLLLATAKSPAMLFYLDNWLSADPDAAKRLDSELAMRRQRFNTVFGGPLSPRPGTNGNPNRVPAQKEERGLNENYGREVMELHTVGVDGGYTQQDVIEMAKCLTGWTVTTPRRNPEFRFDDRLHTSGPKEVMGHSINYGGQKDGEEALKMLANHPSTAKFISTELARHFVSDTPPNSLVERMTQSFEQSGGDIRAVLRTMIYSPEFWSRAAFRAKVKTPLELAASTARALNADVSYPVALVQWVSRMGEPLFHCPPPTGFSDKGETWVNTGALLNRLNFALAFASDRMPGSQTHLAELLDGPTSATADPHAVLDRAFDVFLDNQVADMTRSTIEVRLNDPQILQAKLDDPVKQVNDGLIAGLVLGAPEFQRR